MTDPTETPAPSVARGKNATAKPSFFRALRGIWLFTWKSQLTWRRLPLRVISLLVLPFLVYITTSSPQAWSKRHSLLGNPAMQLDGFSRRLARADLALKPEQHASLQRIFEEEFARAESEPREPPSAETSETDADRLNKQFTACYERIGDRVKTVLDERQFAQFQNFEKRNALVSQSRAKEPVWNWSSPFYHWLIDFYFSSSCR